MRTLKLICLYLHTVRSTQTVSFLEILSLLTCIMWLLSNNDFLQYELTSAPSHCTIADWSRGADLTQATLIGADPQEQKLVSWSNPQGRKYEDFYKKLFF